MRFQAQFHITEWKVRHPSRSSLRSITDHLSLFSGPFRRSQRQRREHHFGDRHEKPQPLIRRRPRPHRLSMGPWCFRRQGSSSGSSNLHTVAHDRSQRRSKTSTKTRPPSSRSSPPCATNLCMNPCALSLCSDLTTHIDFSKPIRVAEHLPTSPASGDPCPLAFATSPKTRASSHQVPLPCAETFLTLYVRVDLPDWCFSTERPLFLAWYPPRKGDRCVDSRPCRSSPRL